MSSAGLLARAVNLGLGDGEQCSELMFRTAGYAATLKAAHETLMRSKRFGVLPATAAEDTLADGAVRDAVRAAQPGATWQTLSLNAHLAEMAANNTQASMPPWNALADFDGAAWPEDEPRDLAKFAAAVVVADAVHTEHAARQRFFTSGSELVALRCKLASLNFQAGRNSSWRVIGVERLSALREAVEQAILDLERIPISTRTPEQRQMLVRLRERERDLRLPLLRGIGLVHRAECCEAGAARRSTMQEAAAALSELDERLDGSAAARAAA